MAGISDRCTERPVNVAETTEVTLKTNASVAPAVRLAVGVPADTLPVLMLVVARAQPARVASDAFRSYTVHTTDEARRMMEAVRPRVVVVDWDVPEVDGLAVCAAARTAKTAVMVLSERPAIAPVALKAGCQAILLKPFAPNLAAARLGRLHRQMTVAPFSERGWPAMPLGTNRTWRDTECPACHAPGAVSFEFTSYRRMWLACLTCDEVWIGERQE